MRGHGLVAEGGPYLFNETGAIERVSRHYGGVGGSGRALCACGEYSDVLPSAHKRKQWHREHKARLQRVGVDETS